MSQSSQVPPGNRPRVFRPFAGGPPTKGNDPSSAGAPAGSMARRPAAARPHRPFASQTAPGIAPEQESVHQQPPVAVSVSAPMPESIAEKPTPSEATPVSPHEAWELSTPAAAAQAPAAPVEPSPEAPALSVTQEVQRLDDHAGSASDETTAEVPMFEYPDEVQQDAAPDVIDVPAADADSASAPEYFAAPATEYFAAPAPEYVGEPATAHFAEPAPEFVDEPVTGYVAESATDFAEPATPCQAHTDERDYGFTYEAPAAAEVPAAPPTSDDSDLPPFMRGEQPHIVQPTVSSEVFETSDFVAPSSEPPTDNLIDEVDAAFITAGLPTQERASHSSLAAAETLEAIARRLREGELQVSQTAASSDAATLAAVLAALLADR